MAKKSETENENDFPFIGKITISQDCSDYREEPNRLSYIFKTEAKDWEAFKQQVKYAVQDWTTSDPTSFARSVKETGRDDLEVQPGKKGYIVASTKVDVTWKMVCIDLPDEIARRHGFVIVEPDMYDEFDEYDRI